MSWDTTVWLLNQWIVPLAAILTAYFTLKTWRSGVVLSMPYIETKVNNGCVTIKLAGLQPDSWQISRLILLRPFSSQFEQMDYVYDDEGNPSFGSSRVLGRWLRGPVPGLRISGNYKSAFVLAKVSLKAAPNIAKWRALRINRKD